MVQSVSGFRFINTMSGRYSQSGTWLTDCEHVPNGSWTLRPRISRGSDGARLTPTIVS
jgi:hypothetical protein